MTETTDGTVAEPTAVDTSAAAVQDTSASVQSNDAPSATQTTDTAQETASTEVTATDTADKLYAGKYKTVEEMEEAYKNLNSKFSQTASEKAELSRILSDAFATESTTAQSGATTQVNDDYGWNDDQPTQQPAQDDSVKRDLSIMKFMYTHEDADANSIKDILASDPLVGSITGYDAKLEYAYLRSQSMSQSKAIETAKKEAAQAAQNKLVEKQAAQVETATQSQPIDDDADLKSRMASSNWETRDAARKEYIRKHLINL